MALGPPLIIPASTLFALLPLDGATGFFHDIFAGAQDSSIQFVQIYVCEANATDAYPCLVALLNTPTFAQDVDDYGALTALRTCTVSVHTAGHVQLSWRKASCPMHAYIKGGSVRCSHETPSFVKLPSIQNRSMGLRSNSAVVRMSSFNTLRDRCFRDQRSS